MTKTRRFEEQVRIQLKCCGQPMELSGNLALRGAGSETTILGYVCGKCFRRVAVHDAWPKMSMETQIETDLTP